MLCMYYGIYANRLKKSGRDGVNTNIGTRATVLESWRHPVKSLNRIIWKGEKCI